jgi:hypothetical protein
MSIARIRDVGLFLFFPKKAHDRRLGALTTVRHFRVGHSRHQASDRSKLDPFY